MPTSTQYELRFQSLFHSGHALALACDSEGHIDLDGLNDSVRESYLHARAVVGRELVAPDVRRRLLH